MLLLLLLLWNVTKRVKRLVKWTFSKAVVPVQQQTRYKGTGSEAQQSSTCTTGQQDTLLNTSLLSVHHKLHCNPGARRFPRKPSPGPLAWIVLRQHQQYVSAGNRGGNSGYNTRASRWRIFSCSCTDFDCNINVGPIFMVPWIIHSPM